MFAKRKLITPPILMGQTQKNNYSTQGYQLLRLWYTRFIINVRPSVVQKCQLRRPRQVFGVEICFCYLVLLFLRCCCFVMFSVVALMCSSLSVFVYFFLFPCQVFLSGGDHGFGRNVTRKAHQLCAEDFFAIASGWDVAVCVRWQISRSKLSLQYLLLGVCSPSPPQETLQETHGTQ